MERPEKELLQLLIRLLHKDFGFFRNNLYLMNQTLGQNKHLLHAHLNQRAPRAIDNAGREEATLRGMLLLHTPACLGVLKSPYSCNSNFP